MARPNGRQRRRSRARRAVAADHAAETLKLVDDRQMPPKPFRLAEAAISNKPNRRG
jgi:hypothetical protein